MAALPQTPSQLAAYCNIYHDPVRDVYITPRGDLSQREMHELIASRGQKGAIDYIMCGIPAGGGPQFTQTSLPGQQPLTATQMQMQSQAHALQMQAAMVVPNSLVQMPQRIWSNLPSAPHIAWRGKSEAIIAGEIIGHRAWALSPYGKLQSVAASYIWEPKQVAEGNPLDGFGIHAYKNIYRLMSEQRGRYIYGAVAMWGDVIEHEHGYRSQYARIVSLDHFDDSIDPSYRTGIEKAYLEAPKPSAG